MGHSVKVLFPGAFTTIQDTGRFGYQAYGVPVTGSLDLFAHAVANALVGNPDEAATLEMTILGPRLTFLETCRIAITGGNLQPFLNGDPFPQWRAVTVKADDTLTFKGVKTGCRAYLAIEGGFDVPRVMGSRSTYPRGGIGGLHGRPLQTGDLLKRGEGKVSRSLSLTEVFVPEYPRQLICRVIPGPQASFFENLEAFYGNSYEITSKADRMGYRLKGPTLAFRPAAPKSILSEAVVPGTIQIPADGQPIVLMGEQTVGGYAKIGVIITPDRYRLAQLRPGDKVLFESIDVEAAHREYRRYRNRLKEIRRFLEPFN